MIDGHSGMTPGVRYVPTTAHGLTRLAARQENWVRLGGNNAQMSEGLRHLVGDVAGPFLKQFPKGFAAMSKLKALSYTSPAELLAERFQMDTRLLKQSMGAQTSGRRERPSS